MWDDDQLVAFVGNTDPSLFVEWYADASGAATRMLLHKALVQRGLLVVGDSYLATFWHEALKTDNLIRKVKEFKDTEANIEDVVANPERDPAFWVLVKSVCSWRGRLDPKAFLEWNVTKHWNQENIIKGLSAIRSLSNCCDVVQADGVEVLESYDDATALLQYPFDFYDRWNEPLRKKCESKQEQEKLITILASRSGRWIVPWQEYRLCKCCEANGVGATWMVVTKMCEPRFFRESIRVSDRQFAAEQNERSLADEKRFHERRARNEPPANPSTGRSKEVN